MPNASRKYFLASAKALGFGYLVLLLLSHGVRLFAPAATPARPAQKLLLLRAVARDQVLPQQVKLAYEDLQPAQPANPPVVLLLHGSPVASITFTSFAPLLGRNCRVLVPDLPGFGHSTRRLPDYSIRSHAEYVLQMLDTLGIARVHVVAYSMGGGVALHLSGRAPARVQSLTMVSSIGVQELELLGDYHLNHAVHGLQLGFLWLLQEGVPHFGYLDDAFLNVSYARNFFDSDQRPLRDLLSQYPGPMLIVHGRHDPLVPLAAAREHHRIVPQSELQILSGGHELIFRKPALLAGIIDQFIQRVEQGAGLTRAQASPERLALAQQSFDAAQVPPPQGLGMVTLVLLLALATFVSEDLTCVSAGLLVARGTLGYFSATLGCLAGIVCGDFLLFFAGKLLGRRALSQPPLKWFVKASAIARGRQWFEREGARVILLSRFLPGSRLPTYVAAGSLNLSFWKFAGYFLLAAALWTPALVGLAALLGGKVMTWLALHGKYSWRLWVALAVGLWLSARVVIPLFSFRGRRLLLSKWRRLTRWEFWPPWAFYPPVVAYCLYLACRHRSLTVFTAANPAIFAGGVIGESKSAILAGLAAADGYLARFRLLAGTAPLEQRIQGVRAFMRELDLTFPIVLKPDVGQRGAGVAVIRSDEEVWAYLRKAVGDTIVQEYVAGHEFGVFYYRFPDQEQGKVLAITDKRFLTLQGDGQRTLEELILSDKRAVCLAPFHLEKHQQHLFEIPAAGEPVALVELGTHCRGAVFYDGSQLKTPQLERAIDRISRSFAGFYFGRFDVRTPSLADFKVGENFKVIELNGVTSEATSLYDPRNSLWRAYRILLQQWRIAFEIGAQNRARGVKPATLRELLRLLIAAKPQN